MSEETKQINEEIKIDNELVLQGNKFDFNH